MKERVTMVQNDNKDLVRAVNELNRTLGQVVRVLEHTNATLVAVGRLLKEETENDAEVRQEGN